MPVASGLSNDTEELRRRIFSKNCKKTGAAYRPGYFWFYSV
jgi:hypothetical protein